MQTKNARANLPAGVVEPHVKRIATVIVLGSIMSILDTTIVNVALDSLSRDLNTPLNNVQWVVTGYLLALAAVIPLSGWAVRRFSAFHVYLTALLLFTAGSALCGLASSAPELIAFRVLQGVGGGMLVPTGLTILVRAAGRENLPKVMSVIGVPMVLAPVFGPTLGGFLLQSVGWHAIFMINVPIGIVTAFVALRLLPRDQPIEGSAGPLDWLGLLLAAAGTVGITFGLSESATAGSFIAMSVVVPVLLGSALVAAFVLRALRIKHPLLDIRLYRIHAYSAASVVTFCLGAALFGAMILLPLYFQVARGQDAIHTGLLLIPQGIGAAIGMNRSAQATRRLGAGLTSLCGGVIMVLATIPFLFIDTTTSFVLIDIAMIVRGVGVGFSFMPAMTAAFSALSHDQIDDGSPQLNVIQRVGGSLGTAVVAVVLQNKLSHLGATVGGHAAAHVSPDAVAAAFAQTYWWVIAMTLVSLIPSAVLWRIERRNRAAGSETGTPDDLLMEILA
ncbi:MAG TPA: DHA2 family efflux MFS transporter permease subunit [Acidimicrobiales bacterium]|nr:DHA2 family efflux MFS transporter permease subunit [Acidimicrobiales bacterium]